MLDLTVKAHRAYLRANAGTQKLFVMLKLLPSPEVASARPQIDLAVVIDTSGSMREPAPGAQIEVIPMNPVTVDGKTYTGTFKGATKLDVAREAARRLLESTNLSADDDLTLVQFDDDADVVAQGKAGADKDALLAGIARLDRYSGGTMMGRGLRAAADALRDDERAVRKVLLLTDGLAMDEEECRAAAKALAELRAPVVALGVGEEYNEDLLAEISSTTLGRPYAIEQMADLPAIFETELGATASQVIDDVRLTLRTVRDVRLASAMRAYPSLSEIDISGESLNLGAIEAGDFTVFVLELDLPERPPVRARMAQLGVTYQAPARGYRGELPPRDLVVEFTDDETLSSQVDAEVMGYVQQRNVDRLVREATEQVKSNPQQAAKTLQLARSMTQRLGNRGMTVALGKAEDELKRSGTIAVGTAKTIKLGARTQTIKAGGPDEAIALPSDEQIREITGA